jgi:hypothetical protein
MTSPLSQFKYAARKIKRMPPPEIVFRLRQKLSQAVEKQRYLRTDRTRPSDINTAAEKLADNLFAFALKIVPGADRTNLEHIQQNHPIFYSQLFECNDDLATSFHHGRWQLFDRSINLTGDLTGPLDWRQDPCGSHQWERRFFTDLDIYNLKDGIDVKYVWELNRHQFLVELARNRLFQNDEKSAGHVKRLLLHWIAENPVNEGVNWTSALEAAMRVISWLHTLAAMNNWPGWTLEDKRAIAASLLDHATYLSRNLSVYSSPYNHLIGEATALLLLSQWLQGYRHADAWNNKAIRILNRFGPAQFYPDGFTVEQAVGYHFYTLGFLIQAVIANRRLGNPSHLAQVEAILEKASLAGAAFKAPDGRWPAIGDMDSARSVPVYPKDEWDFTGLLSLTAAYLKSPTLKSVAESPGAELFWLMGAEGLSEWDRLETTHTPSVHVLPDSGHIISNGNNDDSRLVFKAGPLGHGVHPDDTPSVSHGHADALQILVYVDGKPVLADSGIPHYDGNPESVRHFRTPPAHNTFEVDGISWAKTAGGLAWSNVGPRPELMSNLSGGIRVMAGKIPLGSEVLASRYILSLEDIGIWIADVIISDKPRSVHWYWQIPESREPRLANKDGGGGGYIIDCNGCQMVMNSTDPTLYADLSFGDQKTYHGWIAYGYGQITRSARVHARTTPKEKVLTTTFIGKKCFPGIAVHDGSILKIGDSAFQPSDAIRALPASDIVWIINTGQKILTICAGCRSLLPDCWRFLNGRGEWPVAMKSEEWSP